MHHGAQRVAVAPGAARPFHGIGIELERRKTRRGAAAGAARTRPAQFGQQMRTGTLVHAHGVHRDVATDLTLRVQSDQRRQQIRQEPLDSRFRHAARHTGGNCAPGAQRKRRGAGKGATRRQETGGRRHYRNCAHARSVQRLNSLNIIESATSGHCRKCPSASGCGTIAYRPIFLPPFKP
ncbi:hypothetical protein G6F57_018524 [Rhizopus arrhizus]|nr:hypothetical protein G6F57_018524 [Rhizopus arrhizus]